MIENGEIGIVGGTHDITTGLVTFYDDTMIVNGSKK
jgi:carbonic anhydrase